MLFSLASDKDAAVADLREGGRNGDHWSIQIRRHFQGLGNGCSGLLQVHSFGEDARSKDRQTDSLQWKQERNGKFAITHSGQISLAISQSDHLSLSLSFRSSVPVLRAKGENFPVSRIVVRKHSPPATFPANFSGEFSGDGFFLHRKERLEEISNLSQSTGTRNPSTRRRVRAREPLSGDALPPPGSPDADQPPFLPVCAIRALHVPLLGVLLPFRSMTKYGMASSQVSSVTSPESGGRSEIPNLGGNDSSPILITGHKLNGHNYLQWSQSVLLFICGKGKDEYLTGEAVMPETTEPGFRKWKIENSMIMSWLINSMNNDIGENFLLFGTAKDIWDAAKETYSSSENTSELFQVESALHDFRQGEQSVTQYYNTLTRYWQQLDLFETHSWKCSDDAATYRQIVEQKRLFKFFLGLNRELDDVRGRIMGIKPLPSLREAFSEVRREESRKKVMMGSKEQPAPTLDASALAARSFNSSGGDRQKRDRPWCDYCKKPGHYKETCWKLHGKPADWKPKPRFDRDGRAHVAANSESTSVPEPSPFNKEQMEMLQKLLSQVGSGSTTGVAFTANRGGMRPWIVDTGASDHMTGDAAILQNYKPSNGHSSVHIADGSKSKIAGTGSIKLTKDLYLDSVLHVPNLDCNLLSISKLAHDLQCVTKFYPNLCVFQDLKSGKMIGSAELCSGLYLLSCGQFSTKSLKQVAYSLRFAKHTRTVYPQIPYKPSTVFSLVHSDVWGPSRIKNISGTRWFVTFVDDHTRVTWVFLMKEKSEVGHIFQTFNLMVQNQFNSKIQVLKSDNAKEYFTSSLSTYLQNHGIIHISSCVDTPQQNGVAERKNRHLLEVARCLMFSSNVPNYFWGEAILTATYLINRMPSRVLTFQSPRQLFLKQFPHTHAASSDLPLKVFGCTAFVHVYPQNRSKFAPRANKCIFLGYSPTQKGYKCYSPTNKRFYTTMDVSFFEHVFFYPKSHVQGESMNEHQVWESFLEGVPSFHSESPNPSQFAPTELSTPMPPSVQPAQHTNVPSPVTIQSPMPIQPIAPQLANENLQVYIRRRKRQELEHGSQSTCGQYIDSNSSLPEENIGEDRAGEVLIPSIDDSTLPIALRKGVRRCTDHPIGNYVTYEGLSPSYRAFATSLDDTQVPNTIQEALKISEWKKAVQDEIDALEKNGTWTITDLPLGRGLLSGDFCSCCKTEHYQDPSLIGCQSRLVLATTGHKKCVSKWDLEEEVYMEIPPGFEESMAKNQNLKKYLSEEFEVKDLGNLKYFLGMEVARSRKGIVVSQRKYILDLLKETGMLGCKPIDTPMDSQKKLGIEKESTPVDRGRYQRLVGRLIYLSHTRPDIGFAVSAVSQFMHSPTEEHMEAVYRILRYLKMTPGKGLFFRKTENRDTEVYSDADWAGNIIDRRSTSGYCSFVWGNLVTWRSKKQSVVARSSAEAEYRALAQGICEGIWIKRVLSELGQTSSSPILMMCDNQAAISIAKNPVHHDRTKHVEIDRHFITEKVTSETVKLNYVPTKHQTADILTKALPRPNFEDLTCKLGLYDIYSPA
ncbi:Retrovirus-related Pol polyprotein from transposon RE1 [Vitis vinifera]|uniref:Retrovirus-related Pol polyprotein from transposon RE1 n=1 Tax=Vitis vinifera TaxID=29760 RepID=A0A438EYD4_VITVI|nr:Retrovirus-related Pol polyprotein from transposon RE1 [Vitis vinifera]